MPNRFAKHSQPYLGSGIAIGVAIGAGLGVAFGNLALGMGPGIAIGAALGVAMSRRKRSTRSDKPQTGQDSSGR